MECKGQVAVVTGASRGIGRDVAISLAAAGARVVVGYMEQAAAASAVVAAIAGRGGQALAVQADVTDPIACEQLIRAAADQFGRLDILVNNAGTDLEKLLLDTTIDEWDHLMAVHLRGMYACTRAALPMMIDARYGRIIVVSSIWGISGGSGEVAYSAAKAGQIGFTKALAQETAAWGITVNAVAPGAIKTDMTSALVGPDLAHWLARTPMGRLGLPEEVARIVRFLASPDSGFITGQVWSPNGGVIM